MSGMTALIELEFLSSEDAAMAYQDLKNNKNGKVVTSDNPLVNKLRYLGQFEFTQKKAGYIYLAVENRELEYFEAFLCETFSTLRSSMVLFQDDDSKFVIKNVAGTVETIYSIGEDPKLDEQLEEKEWWLGSCPLIRKYLKKNTDVLTRTLLNKYHRSRDVLIQLKCKSKLEMTKTVAVIEDMKGGLNPDFNLLFQYVIETSYRRKVKDNSLKEKWYPFEKHIGFPKVIRAAHRQIKELPAEIYNNIVEVQTESNTIYLSTRLDDNMELEDELQDSHGNYFESFLRLFIERNISTKARIKVAKPEGDNTPTMFFITDGLQIIDFETEVEADDVSWPSYR
jgi:hypothetical protein